MNADRLKSDSTKRPQNISQWAFGYCEELESIDIPNGVETIGTSAFNECSNLGSVIIPSSVNTIGNTAFYNCKALTTINFQGTMNQWNAITKEPGWDTGAGSYTIKCTDGTITETT